MLKSFRLFSPNYFLFLLQFFFSALLLLHTATTVGQHTVSGRVLDANNSHALAFVHVTANGESVNGTTTNIDGYFKIALSRPITSLDFSYLGYAPFHLELTGQSPTDQELIINLTPTSFQLKEVSITPQENPAIALMARVIANKKRNHPEKLPEFQYQSYNKISYSLNRQDSIAKAFQSLVQPNGRLSLFMMESTTKRKFRAPDQSEEIVLGTKVSGLQHPTFATLATDFQPFSFYDELIVIADNHYLNPICNGCLNKYSYELQDTLYVQDSSSGGIDTTYLVSFVPQKGKNFDGLKGVLYINTRQYALQNVLAQPARKGLIDIRIRQQYQWVASRQWFPEELEFEIVVENYPTKGADLRIDGKSYLYEVQLEPKLRNRDFRIEAVSFADSANLRSNAYWENQRPASLNEFEEATYTVMDSVGNSIHLDRKMFWLESLTRGRFPISVVDLDLTQTLKFNRYEGTRWGLGVVTNKKLWKPMELGGFFGYGSRDKRWKWGGDLDFMLWEYRELKIGGYYHYDVLETGHRGLSSNAGAAFNLRDYMAAQMDRVERFGGHLGFRAFRYAKVDLELEQSDYRPLYNYRFAGPEPDFTNDYTIAQASIKVRYAYREKLIQSFNQRISQGSDYPVISVGYTRGWSGLMDGEIDLQRVEAALDYDFASKQLGITSIRVESGYTEGDLPYGQLFTGEGADDDRLAYVVNNHFQTMEPYAFLSDRYARIFISHNFQHLLFREEAFAPQLILKQHMGIGDLQTAQFHDEVDFETMKHGYFETGLVLNELFRYKYLDLLYGGFGVGLFYRYGAYATDDPGENLAFKLSFTVSTN